MNSFSVAKIENGYIIQTFEEATGQQKNTHAKNEKHLIKEIRKMIGLPIQGRPKITKVKGFDPFAGEPKENE